MSWAYFYCKNIQLYRNLDHPPPIQIFYTIFLLMYTIFINRSKKFTRQLFLNVHSKQFQFQFQRCTDCKNWPSCTISVSNFSTHIMHALLVFRYFDRLYDLITQSNWIKIKKRGALIWCFGFAHRHTSFSFVLIKKNSNSGKDTFKFKGEIMKRYSNCIYWLFFIYIR